ncbi:peptidoglycan-binding domain-containing protein [Devosia submarina]|uniref:peptidoglycan-binding domain-containing protein n=1 Tax=Devosia submarina TaxID=1173082 RepID=UPI000D3A3F5A|nr:peptidoglycan-binding protein [Devosia submarina]
MIPKTWRSAALVAFCSFAFQPAQAQSDVDLLFGIAGELIRQGVQSGEIKRQREQQFQQQQAAEEAERASQEAELAAREAYQIEFYRRTQVALKALGYYNMEVDGATGPGTRSAIAAYQAAFRLPGVFGEQQLYDLEWRASEGWRSADEIDAAEAGGFSDRTAFLKAREAGFTDFDEYSLAVAEGFANADIYYAFLRSGAPDKATFEREAAERAAAEEAVDQCLTATQAQDWPAALTSCYRAAEARPADAAAKLALDTVLAGAQRGLQEGNARLVEKREALAQLLNGTASTSREDVAKLRQEVNTLADDMLFIELHLQAGKCGDLVAQRQWSEAVTTCRNSPTVDHLAGEKREQADQLLAQIEENSDHANRGAEVARAEAAAEANRLALAEGKGKATELLAEVQAYSEAGNQFEQGIAVARAIVALRAANETEDAASIKQHSATLQALLDADIAYVEAQVAMVNARQQAEQTAILEARRQAEVLEAFVLDYVGRNVTSIHVPKLLPLSEALRNALEEGNAERITTAQASSRKELDELGLSSDLSEFSRSFNAPKVSAEELELADAEVANEGLALDNAVAASETLIASVNSFAQGGGKFVKPIDVARSLSRLKAALAQPSLPDLQVSFDALATLLDGDANFAEANAHRSASKDTALANAAALAKEKLTSIDAFLLSYIEANVTADDILSAIDLQMNVEAALAAPASAETVKSLETANAQLEAMKLAALHDEFRIQQTAKAAVPQAPVSENGVAVTLANAELLEGDDEDLLVLRNSAAPHLNYDLVGNLRVDGGVATTCWLHPIPENSIALLMARQELGSMGIDQLDVAQCAEPIKTADLAVLRRGDFLKLSPSEAQPIVAAFEDGRLKSLVKVTGSAAVSETERLTVEANSIASRIKNSTLQGFGLLQLTDGRGGICPVVDDIAPHGSSLAKRADRVAFLFAEPKFLQPTDVEQAFVAAQRGQCSGIYADAAGLRSISEALKHADIAFTTAPVWIETDEVSSEVARLNEEDALQRQQAQAAADLLDAKTADQRSELEVRQTDLRKEYEERATGAKKDIADIVRELVETGKSDTLAQLFPTTNQHLLGVTADKWVITGTVDELADYGKATWQGRDVEALLVRLHVKRENAILGLYATDCMVLGYLVDREFRIHRDPVEASCTDAASIAKWRDGRNVESVWNLLVE